MEPRYFYAPIEVLRSARRLARSPTDVHKRSSSVDFFRTAAILAALVVGQSCAVTYSVSVSSPDIGPVPGTDTVTMKSLRTVAGEFSAPVVRLFSPHLVTLTKYVRIETSPARDFPR